MFVIYIKFIVLFWNFLSDFGLVFSLGGIFGMVGNIRSMLFCNSNNEVNF